MPSDLAHYFVFHYNDLELLPVSNTVMRVPPCCTNRAHRGAEFASAGVSMEELLAELFGKIEMVNRAAAQWNA
jgi:hypothetical protein